MKKKHSIFLLFLLSYIFSFAQLPLGIPDSGLVAYYGFDGNANDLSGNDNHGKLACGTGTNDTLPLLTTDRFGIPNSAYLFGGVDSRNWIEVANSTSLTFTEKKMTISFWMKQDSPRGENSSLQTVNNDAFFTIISKGGAYDYSGVGAGFRIQSSYTSNKAQMIDYTMNNIGIQSQLNCYEPGQWIHCVVMINKNREYLYINGVLYSSSNYSDTISRSANFSTANLRPLYIGRLYCSSNTTARYTFSGALDDIAIYDRILSNDEVKQLYGNYVDPTGAANHIDVDSVVVENPCGGTYGHVYLYPRETPGVEYHYALGNRNNIQDENSLKVRPGTYRCFVMSQCGLWDTVVEPVCDCEPPHQVHYDTICPGDTGMSGGIESMAFYDFEMWRGWTHDGHWMLNTRDENNEHASSGTYYVYGYRGYSAFCLTYWGSFVDSYNSLISPAITIDHDLARVSCKFAYSAMTLIINNKAVWHTLSFQYSTSPDGPWSTLWTNWDGGEDSEDDSWRIATVSLSALPSQGEYYFRFYHAGSGYLSAIDNFEIFYDTRWEIPEEATNGRPWSSVVVSKELENTGLCPIEETTHWFIKKNSHSDTSVVFYHPYTWNGETYTESGDYPYNNDGKLKNQYGCDSSIILHLSVDLTNSSDTFVSVCDAFFWNDSLYTESTLDSVVCRACNYQGGDSTARLHLTIYPSTDERIYDSICENGTYTFADRVLTEPGRYDTLLTSIHGCDSMVRLTLYLAIRPMVSLNFDVDCEENEYVILGTKDRGRPSWRTIPDDQNLYERAEESRVRYAPKRNMTVIFSSELPNVPGCSSSASVNLSRLATVKAEIHAQPEFLSFDNLTLTATATDDAASSYVWHINGQYYARTGQAIKYTASPEDDEVLITLHESNGFCEDSTWITIPIIRSSLFVPNVFRPLLNGSGHPDYEVNSHFRAQGTGIIEFEMFVYNRRGILVFHSTNINESWDGKADGIDCPQGSYTYIIHYKDQISPIHWQTTTGTVLLLH